MILHVFTEEKSAEILLDTLLEKLLPKEISYRIYTHQGKQDLEKSLIKCLPTISKIPNSKVLVIRDQDSGNCSVIKKDLITLIERNCYCSFSVRIACREMEAWFLGDLDAINQAFPRFKPEKYKNKSNFRIVDNINNPSKYLLKIIPEYTGRKVLPKLEVAKKIAPFLDIDKNNSSSFRNTIKAIRNLCDL